jgi:hypothetical protein
MVESAAMSTASAAIAIFVKTPGLSPVKTRLAAQIGREAADRFYELSLAAVEATVVNAAASCDVVPHWAVAEKEGLSDRRWQRFPRIWQGRGGLGDRLAHVFESLGDEFPIIVAIGADSPQLTPEHIRHAVERLKRSDDDATHALGRCHDGGFYLVGTNVALPREVWRDVPYSTPQAADRLAAGLVLHGEIVELERITDVDQADDLGMLHQELDKVDERSKEQVVLREWSARMIAVR